MGFVCFGFNRTDRVRPEPRRVRSVEEFSDMDGRFRKQCKYLFPGGVTRKISGVWISRAEAQDEFCHLFHD